MAADFTRKQTFVLGCLTPFLFIACLIGILIFLKEPVPRFADRIAEQVFANALVSSDREHAVTVSFPAWSSDEVASLPGRGEGLNCSIPPAVERLIFSGSGSDNAPISLQFRQACIAHDLCYRHGAATYGYSQSQCDTFLVEAAFRICPKVYRENGGVAACQTRARKVLGGLVFGGSSAFKGLPVKKMQSITGSETVGSEQKGAKPSAISTIAEYDPYPSGSAIYVAPRLISGNCNGKQTSILLNFLRRPGGSAYSSRCYDPASGLFGKPVNYYKIGSEYDQVVSAPWIARLTEGDRLVRWCRDKTDENATGGYFIFQTDPTIIPDCETLDRSKIEWEDAPLTQFPLPTAFQRTLKSNLATVGLLDIKSEKVITPCKLLPMPLPSPGQERSIKKRVIELPPVADSKSQDCYRWFAAPPMMIKKPDGKVEVLLSRRGSDNGSSYVERLTTASKMVDRNGEFNRDWEIEHWKIPETAEPVFPLDTVSGTKLVSIRRMSILEPTKIAYGVSAALLFMGLVVLVYVFIFRNKLSRVTVLFGWFCVVALISGTIWMRSNRAATSRFTDDAIVSVYSSGGNNLPDPKDRTILDGARFLQNRIPIVTPMSPLPCESVNAQIGCRISEIAYLPAFSISKDIDRAVQLELHLVGFDKQGAVHKWENSLTLKLQRINEFCGGPKVSTEERTTCPINLISRLMFIVGHFDDKDPIADILVFDRDDAGRQTAFVSRGSSDGFQGVSFDLAGGVQNK